MTLLKKWLIQSGTDEFLLQNHQNKLRCRAVRQLGDGMIAFSGAEFCHKSELAIETILSNVAISDLIPSPGMRKGTFFDPLFLG